LANGTVGRFQLIATKTTDRGGHVGRRGVHVTRGRRELRVAGEHAHGFDVRSDLEKPEQE
jgi:hypothetical protein